MNSVDRFPGSINVDRRTIVKAAIAASLPVAMGSRKVAEVVRDQPIGFSEISHTPSVEGPLKVGSLDLYTLPIHHKKEDWEAYSTIVGDAVQSVSVVMPEYFPEEYMGTNMGEAIDKLNGDKLHVVGNDNTFFKYFEDLAHEQNKQVWALDPACGPEWVGVRASLQAPGAITTGVYTYAALDLYNKLRDRLSQKQDVSEKNLSRRKFLQGAIATAAAITGMGTGGSVGGEVASSFNNVIDQSSPTDPALYVEQDIRRVMVAEHIVKLGQILPPGTKSLLVYPPTHAEAITNYINNPEERKARLNIYEELRNIPQLASSFRARHYTPSLDGWTKIGEISS